MFTLHDKPQVASEIVRATGVEEGCLVSLVERDGSVVRATHWTPIYGIAVSAEDGKAVVIPFSGKAPRLIVDAGQAFAFPSLNNDGCTISPAPGAGDADFDFVYWEPFALTCDLKPSRLWRPQ